MRALVKTEAAKGLTLKDMPEPEVRAGEVKIRIKKVAICGTDLHIYNWDEWSQANIKPPVITGHEFVGYIEELGDGVTGLSVGQRVSGEGHIVCGRCRNCRSGRKHFCPFTKGVGINRNGAFADFLVIPEENVCPIPDGISDDYAAILDPFGNAVHTALSFDLVGEDVLITGAGPIGLMAAAICRHVGARRIVVSDVNEERLKMAEAMGADVGYKPGKDDLRQLMASLDIHEGFDVGLEMSGAEAALKEMLDAMNHGGNVALLGIYGGDVKLDLNRAIFKSLRFKGIYGREMFDTWYKGMAMLQSGLDISPIISTTLPLEDFERGFAMLNNGEAYKVLLQF